MSSHEVPHLGLLEDSRNRARSSSCPGVGFKVKIDDRWRNYAKSVDELLSICYKTGVPSLRMLVKGSMYEFDFETMKMRNLVTVSPQDMKAPFNLDRPAPTSQACETLRNGLSVGRNGPVYALRVPKGSPGTTIRVPHPTKLGKPFPIFVPKEAVVDKPLFVPIPASKKKLKYLGYGAGASGAVFVGSEIATGFGIGGVGGAGVAGAAGAGAAGVAAAALPFILGGAAIAGLGAVAVHYSRRNPMKAAAVGALTIGGLALADHVAEVGVAEAAGDVAEAAGDLVEGVGDAAEFVADRAEDAADALGDLHHGVSDWLDGPGADAVGFVEDLFEDIF
eukprot:TRINITY_DN10325_c0_g1_i1.p1 TRINITY_DN10325_c0_g1~~TRINITY_DN10325_c0_g1_i1.p1  ORF type:complete len:335 (-),score=62.96 TRINITY_DN10325_c0_g1_i1:178-1182(-)